MQGVFDGAKGGFTKNGCQMNRPLIKKISGRVVLGAMGIVLLWDLFAQIFGGLETTVSNVIWEFNRENQWVGYLIGLFNGHLLWGSPYAKDKKDLIKGDGKIVDVQILDFEADAEKVKEIYEKGPKK